MKKTLPDDLSIPDFLRRKRSKKDIKSEYVAPKQREIVTRYGQPKTEVIKDNLPQVTKVKAYRPSIQEAIREKHSNMIGEIEGMIDDGLPADFSMFKYLTKIEATPMAARAIAEKFAPVALEMNDILTLAEDEQLQEGYANLSWEEVETFFNLFSSIVEDCSKYGEVNRKVKAVARKQKPVKKEKLLKTFQYLDKDDSLKIASVNPEKVIGAFELWTFNIKSKQLCVYRTLDRAGLSVKGTTITNFDEKNSFAKIAGRKAPEVINSVLTGGKIVLRKVMDTINTKAIVPGGRINKTTILLKVL